MKQRQAHRVQEAAIEEFDLPIIDPGFLIIERNPDKLHAFARGLLKRLRKPSRTYTLEMVKAATVWLVDAYVDAQVPLAPEMSALIAGVVNWQRRASTFRKVQEINEKHYWAAIRFEASKPPDPKGEAPSSASRYSVAKHVLELGGGNLPRQGTRIPRNIDGSPDPAITTQKSAEATIRGWRRIDHYRQNVRLQRESIGNFKKVRSSPSTHGVKK